MRSCSSPISVRQRRLITDGAGHAAEQRRHFRAGLREAEDVVDEQQRVGAGRIAELLGHRQRRQGHAQPAPGGSFIWPKTIAGLIDDALAGVADLGFLHFQPQVVAFAGAFADAGEHRITAVLRWRCGR